jgi:hypothetical protein
MINIASTWAGMMTQTLAKEKDNAAKANNIYYKRTALAAEPNGVQKYDGPPPGSNLYDTVHAQFIEKLNQKIAFARQIHPMQSGDDNSLIHFINDNRTAFEAAYENKDVNNFDEFKNKYLVTPTPASYFKPVFNACKGGLNAFGKWTGCSTRRSGKPVNTVNVPRNAQRSRAASPPPRRGGHRTRRRRLTRRLR